MTADLKRYAQGKLEFRQNQADMNLMMALKKEGKFCERVRL